MMKMMLKKLNTALILIICSALLVACGDDDAKKPDVIRPVKTIVVKDPQQTSVRYFPGKVIANKEADLSFEVSGKLIELPIKEGMLVKTGDLIGKIDPQKYQDKVDETKADLIRAEGQYKRAQRLIKDKYISEAEYDAKKAKYLMAKANYNTAKKDLRDTSLFAPFAGIIARKFVDQFQLIKAKEPIVRLQVTALVDIEINVPENIIVNLKETQRTSEPVAIFDSLPGKEFPIEFKEFSAQADPDTQTYRVVFTMKRPEDLNILPGMTATIKAELPDYKSGGEAFYLLPASAVFKDKAKKPAVWLVEPKTMTVKRVEVKVSRMNDEQIRVLSGIKTGDRVVVAGVHFLHDGDKVKLLDESQKRSGQTS